MAPKLKLVYFDFPGRAEPSRLMLALGKVPFEDSTFSMEQWPALKPTMPFLQVPVLEVGEGSDKLVLAQSGTINRYVAKLTGLYPTDPLEAARTETADNQLRDLYEPIVATFYFPDQEAAVKERLALLEGQVGTALALLDKYVASSGGPYVLGSKFTWVDIVIYSVTSNLIGGFFAGMPADLLDKYPSLKTLHDTVAARREVASHYVTATHPLRGSYKAAAAASA